MHVGMTTFFQNIGRPISDYEVYRHEISMADLAELILSGVPNIISTITQCAPTWPSS